MGRWLERPELVLLYSEQSSYAVSLCFQAVLISFLSLSACQLTCGSLYASEVWIFKSSHCLFWYLFACQSRNTVCNLASAEKEKMVSQAFRFPWAQVGFQVPSKTSAFTKAPGPCFYCLGVWGSDVTALASGSLLPAELQHWERDLCLLSSHDLQQSGITLAVYWWREQTELMKLEELGFSEVYHVPLLAPLLVLSLYFLLHLWRQITEVKSKGELCSLSVRCSYFMASCLSLSSQSFIGICCPQQNISTCSFWGPACRLLLFVHIIVDVKWIYPFWSHQTKEKSNLLNIRRE